MRDATPTSAAAFRLTGDVGQIASGSNGTNGASPGHETHAATEVGSTAQSHIAERSDPARPSRKGWWQRRFGSVVRLKVSRAMPRHVLNILVSNLEIDRTEVYRVDGPLGLKRLMSLYALDRPELKDPPFVPAVPPEVTGHGEEDDLFAAVRRQDIMLHHPYDSFQPVIDFLRKAAQDDNVLAIKVVLYRVGRNSPIVEALLEAMENQKQVAVLVELKARFD
jgi:polyphosphate kinase